MLASFALFSGLSRSAKVAAGILANASSVGAKTVNGPGPLSVSTKPAALTAASRVLNLPALSATAGIESVAGIMTVSMTWITPLVQLISVFDTLDESTLTAPPLTLTSIR